MGTWAHCAVPSLHVGMQSLCSQLKPAPLPVTCGLTSIDVTLAGPVQICPTYSLTTSTSASWGSPWDWSTFSLCSRTLKAFWSFCHALIPGQGSGSSLKDPSGHPRFQSPSSFPHAGDLYFSSSLCIVQNLSSLPNPFSVPWRPKSQENITFFADTQC